MAVQTEVEWMGRRIQEKWNRRVMGGRQKVCERGDQTEQKWRSRSGKIESEEA